MKARVKATGDIVDVTYSHATRDGVKYYDIEKSGYVMVEDELDFDFSYSPDYWERLEHQAAIGAMQGILSNPEVDLDYKSDECMPQAVAATAYNIAHALVEKYKKEANNG